MMTKPRPTFHGGPLDGAEVPLDWEDNVCVTGWGAAGRYAIYRPRPDGGYDFGGIVTEDDLGKVVSGE